MSAPVEFDPSNKDHVTAQVVIDTMRFALGAQKDPRQRMRIVEALLGLAPATEDDKGIEFIRHLIVEGRLSVQMVPEQGRENVDA